jgi:hypothetical protein
MTDSRLFLKSRGSQNLLTVNNCRDLIVEPTLYPLPSTLYPLPSTLYPLPSTLLTTTN